MRLKFIIVFTFFLCGVSIHIFAGEQQYIRAEFMETDVAQKKWGDKKFIPEVFKKNLPEERATMASDLIKQQHYIGKNLSYVKDQLGTPDGFFFTDSIPAYQIELYTEKKKEAWQIVFLPDESHPEKIGAVKIHKKCCYKEEKLP